MIVPEQPKIYHIVHTDRLKAIISDGYLWCDAEILRRSPSGTSIGMDKIKLRRLNELTLTSHRDLHVGECVPFYFCPRSIMLYLIYQANHPELTYTGGQSKIIHLEADLKKAVAWADNNQRRWAFTLSNAGSRFFEDRCDLSRLHEINWDAVHAGQWGGSSSFKEGKQAEFLVEHCFPWFLIDRIGVYSAEIHKEVSTCLSDAGIAHRPVIELKKDWYY